MRSATVLLALALAATAHAKSFDDDLPAVSSAIGGEPQEFVLVQRAVAGYFVTMRLAYRDGVFSLVNRKAEVRHQFRCDEIKLLSVDPGRVWDSVTVQTPSELHRLRVINVTGHERDVFRMVALLQGCAGGQRVPA